METRQLVAAIDQWASRLAACIMQLTERGSNVYLVALSRKMPRFFKWILENTEGENVQKLKQLLDCPNVELITEYAIPLVAAAEKGKVIDAIILDDVLIYGSTANNAALEWLGTTGRAPKILPIFISKQGRLIPYCLPEGYNEVPVFDLDRIGEVVAEVAHRIIQSKLPVDMEYPILHIDAPYQEVKDWMCAHIPGDWIRYDVKSDFDEKAISSFTVILGNESDALYNNDFAKVRLFPAEDDSCIIEIIAPNIVMIDAVSAENLFRQPHYQELWNFVAGIVSEVTEAEVENQSERFSDEWFEFAQDTAGVEMLQLLGVWANYLYSLSSFIRNKDELIPPHATAKVEVSDLQLLLGGMLAVDMCAMINDTIQKGLVSDSVRHRVALPSYVNPADMREAYLGEQLSAMRPGNSLDDNLDQAMKAGHFASGFIRELKEKDYFEHSNFGETFDSLERLVKDFHLDTEDFDEPINHWIDTRIDECRVAPKYKFVVGSDGRIYMRRFFCCGTNPF